MNKPTLLIVDDEIDIRRPIMDFLQDEFNFLEAGSGAEALNILKKQHVDLILTDYNMPDLDGMELIKSLHEVSALVPVIVLTGRGSQELRLATLAYDVFEYIEKPFQLKELRNSLRKCLIYYSSHTGTAEEPNIFSKASYDDLHIKLAKSITQELRDYCQHSGLSVTAFVEQLVYDKIRSKKG